MSAPARATGRVVDLSHDYRTGMPHGTTIPTPQFLISRTLEEHGLRVMELRLPTHVGTHLDAPSHFIPDGTTVDQVPVTDLVGRALCVEVELEADEPIGADQLVDGARGGSRGDALLIRTGWDRKYMDDDYLHHPYLSQEAADWVVERGFRLVGVDTVTPDLPGPLRPDRFTYPVHKTLLGNGVLILENLVLHEVVDRSFLLFIGALRISGGDGSPARVLAVLDN